MEIPEGNTRRLKRLLEDQGAFKSFYQNPSFGRRFDPDLVGPSPSKYQRNAVLGSIARNDASIGMSGYGPFTVPAPSGGQPYDLGALWREINGREVAARKSRRDSRSLDAYQRAFFGTFPDLLPLHVEGYPIRLTYEQRELWNRVKPAGRKRMARRYKPRRAYRRRAPVRRAPVRRRRAGTYRRRG